jgi:D-alanine-D-alanine ligase
LMKKNIAIITGGNSSEIVISLKSAEQVRTCLDTGKYNTYIVFIKNSEWQVRLDDGQQAPIDRHDFTFRKGVRKIKFDYAFFAMHGPPGENGILQAYFDLLSIPYSTSGVLPLALTFNKYVCKTFLSHCGIRTAIAVLLRKNEQFVAEEILSKTGLPCFVKPNCSGSSFGVSLINNAGELNMAIEKALNEDTEVIIEEYIKGTELTCGLVKMKDKELIFPVTEIVSKKEFFDYEAKYTTGLSDEITPARIPEEISSKCKSISSHIYSLLNCTGLVRIDFICRDGELYFLELNGIPGMTDGSIVPRQIRAYGLTESVVYEMIINDTAGWGE